MSGMIAECGIDILALLLLGISFGVGYWWMHHLMKKIWLSHNWREYRKCNHHFVIILKCTKCSLERKK